MIKTPFTKKHLVFLLPILILLGMTVTPLLTIMTGKEIYLPTEPVDPRDLFRGDYVTLNYEVNTVGKEKVEEGIKTYFEEREAGSTITKPLTVYTVLEEHSGGMYEVERVVEKKPTSGIYLEGTIRYLKLYTDEELGKFATDEADFKRLQKSETVSIDYNLDRYFVAENQGEELEQAIQNGSSKKSLVAVVKVRNGHAVLSSVQVNDTSSIKK